MKGKIMAIFFTIIMIFVTGAGKASSEAQFRKIEYHRFPILLKEYGAKKEKMVVACVGDSITFGTGVGDPAAGSYPALLQQYLGPDYEVKNFGVPGATMTEKGRCYRSYPEYQQSIDCKAKAYIIMLGTNDTGVWDAKIYERDLTNLIRTYRKVEPDTQIYLMIPPDLFQQSGEEGFVGRKIIQDEIGPIIVRAARRSHTTGMLDLFQLTKGKKEWFVDGIHPNETGYNQIAEYIYQNVRRDLVLLPKMQSVWNRYLRTDL